MLQRHAATASVYMLIVAGLALAVWCAAMLYRAWNAERLRQTGRKHDNLQFGEDSTRQIPGTVDDQASSAGASRRSMPS